MPSSCCFLSLGGVFIVSLVFVRFWCVSVSRGGCLVCVLLPLRGWCPLCLVSWLICVRSSVLVLVPAGRCCSVLSVFCSLVAYLHSCTCRCVRGWSPCCVGIRWGVAFSSVVRMLVAGAYSLGCLSRCLLLLPCLSFGRGACVSPPWWLLVCLWRLRMIVGVPAGLLSCFCLCLLPCWLVSDSLQGLRPSLVAWLSSCWSLSVVVSLAGGLFFMFEASAFGGVSCSVARLSFVVLM